MLLSSRRCPPIPVLSALTLLAACSVGQAGPGESAALTVVGESSLFLERDETAELTVRYHDPAGAPLAGEVEFVLEHAEPGGSSSSPLSLASSSAATDAEGLARVTVRAGPGAGAPVRVLARAAGAAPAEWTVEPIGLLSGRYELESRLDVSAALDGADGPLGALLEATDDPADPATWLLDRIAEEDETVGDVLSFFRPALDAELAALLQEEAPDLVPRMIAVADGLRQAAASSVLVSELDLSRGRSGYGAEHSVVGVALETSGGAYELALDEAPDGAREIAIARDPRGDVRIGEHTLSIPFGPMIALALDRLVAPQVDPGASSLAELLSRALACDTLAADLYQATGVFSEGSWEIFCELGAAAAAGEVLDELAEADAGAAVLELRGRTVAVDSVGDGVIDRLEEGRWEGTLRVGARPYALPPEQSFDAARR